MADEKSKTDGRDGSKVSPREHYELSYHEEKLGVCRRLVKDAIKRVGDSREKVEQYLAKA